MAEQRSPMFRDPDWISNRLGVYSVPGGLRARSAATLPQTQHRPSRPHVHEGPKIRPRIMAEALFKEVLQRERKRAARSNQPLLMVLTTMDGPAVESPGIPAIAMEAVAAVNGETDIVGWFESQKAIGAIMTEMPAVDASVARQLEARVRWELARRFDPATLNRFSVRSYVHPKPTSAIAGGPLPLDPLLEELQALDHRTGGYRALKRVMDIAGSFTLLVFLSPILLLLAALVKLTSPGPVFFRQSRVGQKAVPFTMFKFRTMCLDADDAIHQAYVSQFIHSGGQNGKSHEGLFKMVNDPRVTALGHFLRKSSLDELPQFLNVLRGEMSLVGPRPPLQYEVERYKAWHRHRILEAKPGITGLWQVTGRSRTTFDEMVRLDLQYARNCSLLTDLKILLATPAAVISGKGAC